MYISDKQVVAMDMVDSLVRVFGELRWFTQVELPGITKHTMDALVFKHFLDRKEVFGVVYYRRLKELKED